MLAWSGSGGWPFLRETNIPGMHGFARFCMLQCPKGLFFGEFGGWLLTTVYFWRYTVNIPHGGCEMVKVSEVAVKAEVSERDARATLRLGWSTALLEAASGVDRSYYRYQARLGAWRSVKVGRDYLLHRSDVDPWLVSRGVVVEDLPDPVSW